MVGCMTGDQDVAAALVRQWELIAGVIPKIVLTRSSRIEGWRNAGGAG